MFKTQPQGPETSGTNQRVKLNITDDSDEHESLQICLKRTNDIPFSNTATLVKGTFLTVSDLQPDRTYDSLFSNVDH